MRLLCLTDLHGDARQLRSILDEAGTVDVVLLGGDLTHFGTPNQVEDLIRRTREHCPRVFAVAGNCDSVAIDSRLAELGVSLFGRGVVHDGAAFYGVSAMPPWTGHMYELTEEEIAAALAEGERQAGAVARQVVLSHPPPRGCRLDVTRRGDHVGSTAVRRHVDDRQPTLVVCGHIHEARGVERLGATTVVNCGTACQGNYAVALLGDSVIVELRTVAA